MRRLQNVWHILSPNHTSTSDWAGDEDAVHNALTETIDDLKACAVPTCSLFLPIASTAQQVPEVKAEHPFAYAESAAVTSHDTVTNDTCNSSSLGAYVVVSLQ